MRPSGRLVKRSTKAQDKESKLIRRSNTVPCRRIKNPRYTGYPGVGDFSGETLSESTSGISSSGTDTDWELASISPQFTMPCNSSDESAGKSTISDFLASPNDFLVGFFESANDVQQPILEMESFTARQEIEPFFPAEERLLTKLERSEIYDLISSGINSFNDSERLSNNSSAFGSQISLELPSQASNMCINPVEYAHSGGQDFKAWLPGDIDIYQPILDMHGTSSARGLFDDSLGYLDSYFGPVTSCVTEMVGDSDHQTVMLSFQNKPSFKTVANVKQVRPLILPS